MKEKNILYTLVKAICYPFFMLLYHPKIVGKENIIQEPLIICGNHKKPLDVFLLASSTRRKLHFFSKIELFNSKFKSSFFRKLGCIPVNRKEKNKEALIEGYECLNNSKTVVIFPEGTTNKTNEVLLLPFKFGAVSMAKKTDATIVPFGIMGSHKVFNRNLICVFGKPFKVGEKTLEEANELLRMEIEKLVLEAEKISLK